MSGNFAFPQHPTPNTQRPLMLTPEDVKKVALLSRLELTDAEIETQATHLNALLEQFEILAKIDVTEVPPTSHAIPMTNILREDVIKPSLSRQEVLANAPASRDGCFVVPMILEG